jgi:hypothetical protein
MKLLRHFLAVSVAVGLVVALGFIWSTSGAASIVADERGGRLPDRAQPGTSSVTLDNFDRRGAGGFSLSNISDLLQTLLILALITAAVVIIDRTRRRYGPRRFPVRGSGPSA